MKKARKKLSKRQASRLYKRGSKVKRRNFVMGYRGGIRL